MIVGCHGMGWIPAKPSTRINRSVASPSDLIKNAGGWTSNALVGGDAYQTNISEFDKGMKTLVLVSSNTSSLTIVI